MVQISNLAISDVEKRDLVKALFERYTADLRTDLKNAKSNDEVVKMFNHFINNSLSIIETQAKEVFVPMRRLILNEIHGCKDQILKILPQKNETP
jgi:hypothetical protein